jgi:hypothetical protein
VRLPISPIASPSRRFRLSRAISHLRQGSGVTWALFAGCMGTRPFLDLVADAVDEPLALTPVEQCGSWPTRDPHSRAPGGGFQFRTNDGSHRLDALGRDDLEDVIRGSNEAPRRTGGGCGIGLWSGRRFVGHVAPAGLEKHFARACGSELLALGNSSCVSEEDNSEGDATLACASVRECHMKVVTTASTVSRTRAPSTGLSCSAASR